MDTAKMALAPRLDCPARLSHLPGGLFPEEGQRNNGLAPSPVILGAVKDLDLIAVAYTDVQLLPLTSACCRN